MTESMSFLLLKFACFGDQTLVIFINFLMKADVDGRTILSLTSIFTRIHMIAICFAPQFHTLVTIHFPIAAIP